MPNTEAKADALTAGQLRDLLARFPQDRIVVMSTDADGRGSYFPAAAVVEGMYVLDDEARGTAYPTPEVLARDEDARRHFGEAPENAVRAVVLYPTD